ncbi:MAG TPA: methyltransferase domain-containing protein [Candidatus Angelobacter sp.]|jgi:SAM-dependent methyltransferase|nr:methyltransferase domain-containing protein [Candidatus Angelobacter sp.]
MNPQISDLLQMDVLNLGCGRKHLPGAINLDITAATSPDITHDLNLRPWPFPGNHFREVHAYDVIEHVDDVVAVMEEIHRICQPKAIVRITVPHFSCRNAYTDPTHRHFFSCDSFRYFNGEDDLGFYTKARFRVVTNRIFFDPTLLNKLIWRLANRYPETYEQRWAWIFPAWFLQFNLEVSKASEL